MTSPLPDESTTNTDGTTNIPVPTVYAVIFEGRKFRRFRCKLVEREILILKRSSSLRKHCIRLADQQKLNRENPYRLVFCEI